MSLGFDTRLVRVATTGENQPLSEPIVLATTYAAPSAAKHREMFQDGSTTFYRRFGNPTAASAARLIADLEGADAGIVFGSGMGAIATALLAVLRAGDHVIASREIFAQTRTVLDTVLRGYGVETEFVDAERADQVECLDARITEDDHRSRHRSSVGHAPPWRLCHGPHELGHRDLDCASCEKTDTNAEQSLT